MKIKNSEEQYENINKYNATEVLRELSKDIDNNKFLKLIEHALKLLTTQDIEKGFNEKNLSKIFYILSKSYYCVFFNYGIKKISLLTYGIKNLVFIEKILRKMI